MIKTIITGKGSSGSWQVRGVQLGGAIGADVYPRSGNFEGYDRVICVKRIPKETVQALKERDRPWVWDIVDAWPQPEGNSWSRKQAIAWLKGEISALQPSAIVFPTSQMLLDSCWIGPSLVLPHHAWPKYKPRELRSSVLAIGYEGGMQYLGKWLEPLHRECNRRGWVFSHNDRLETCDIAVALRDTSGYPCANWKSNCKLANIQALGIPAICSPEKGYIEFGSGKEIFIDSPDQLSDALATLRAEAVRRIVGTVMSMSVPTLKNVSERYMQWLQALSF